MFLHGWLAIFAAPCGAAETSSLIQVVNLGNKFAAREDETCLHEPVATGTEVSFKSLEPELAVSFKRYCSMDPCDLSWDCLLDDGFLKLGNETADGSGAPQAQKVGPSNSSVIEPNLTMVEAALRDEKFSHLQFEDTASSRIGSMFIHTPLSSKVDPKHNQNARWYQEHNNTQVFRLFDGEYNLRNDWRGKSAARLEAFSTELGWQYSTESPTWHTFEGMYTIISPTDSDLLQLYSTPNLMRWTILISLLPNGSVVLSQRGDNRTEQGPTNHTIVITRDEMTGSKRLNAYALPQFVLKVMDNGRETKTFINGELVSHFYDTNRVAGNTVFKEGHATNMSVETAVKWYFRWGVYAKSHQALHAGVENHCAGSLVFVSGANISTQPDVD